MEQVFLVRHATPDWSRRDSSYHIPPGPPLTLVGQKEAQELGIFLNFYGVRWLWTSPLERCERTARIAAAACLAAVAVVDTLAEWRPGENSQAVLERVQPVFEQARLASQDSAPVALVTHGGPISALLLALGMDEHELAHRKIYDYANPVPPAGAWLATREHSHVPWELELAFMPEAVAI